MFRVLSRFLGFLHLQKNKHVLSSSRPIVLWTHLGLGDQISMAKLFEELEHQGFELHIPCKERNLNNLSQMFSYLRCVIWHPISNNPKLEKSEVLRLASSLSVPVVDLGRFVLEYLRWIRPDKGLNTLMMLSGGLDTKGLFSARFRQWVLSLDQITPPQEDYLFENWEASQRVWQRPAFLSKEFAGLMSVSPESRYPLFQYALILDSAKLIAVPGSAFMCLAMVIGARSPQKVFVSDVKLLTDDPDSLWQNRIPAGMLSAHSNPLLS